MGTLVVLAALFGFDTLITYRARRTLASWAQREGYRIGACRHRRFWEKGYRWNRGDNVFEIRVTDAEGRKKSGDAVVGDWFSFGGGGDVRVVWV